MKNRIGKIAKYIFNKRYRLGVRLNLGKYDHLADEEFLRLRYFAVYGRELNLDAPELYSEKVQWLKLYDRKPEYTVMSDKYLARDYVAQRIGEEHLIPLLGVWDDPAEIDFDQLPDSFVLKFFQCGSVFIASTKQSSNASRFSIFSKWILFKNLC